MSCNLENYTLTLHIAKYATYSHKDHGKSKAAHTWYSIKDISMLLPKSLKTTTLASMIWMLLALNLATLENEHE